MNRLVCLLFLSMLVSNANAQETEKSPHYLGIDIINSIPTYLFPNRYFIRKTIIIEPYYLLPIKKPNRGFLIGAGFADGSTHEYSFHYPSQHFRGVYFRMAYEIKKTQGWQKMLRVGYGPVLSFAGYSGNYRFAGPAFGDYNGSFHEKGQVALGTEGYVAYDINLNKKLFLRLLIRNVIGARTKPSVYAQYFPGLGYGFPWANNRFLYSANFSVGLFHKVR
ncbi:hypothetical protein [Dyadobacter aurulentus]|uniref:hypothetical protein n=1 Tax=Dyadobacter sp. UC 10 TaxID=2605428 RepID=UPI0011F30682|nr:hypothetical protein [Dyadobacter sp. UC 10]KAA0990111.1 hypothetical protein FXO21_08030 [Dyadobacter sp. UC 10]